VLLGLEAEATLERVDRLLERVVIERHQQPAAVADEMMMVMVVLLERRALIACDSVTDVDAGDQPQVLQHLDPAVDAGDTHRPSHNALLQPGAEPLVDLLNGERALLASEQFDQHIAGTTSPVTGPMNLRACAICPRLLLVAQLGVRTERRGGDDLGALLCTTRPTHAPLVLLAGEVLLGDALGGPTTEHVDLLLAGLVDPASALLGLQSVAHVLIGCHRKTEHTLINAKTIMRIRIIIVIFGKVMRQKLRFRPARAIRALMLLGLASASMVLAGCGRSGAGTQAQIHRGGARILAVGAENQYANVISQIGGRYVAVSAIMSNPNTDPHTFEASVEVAQTVSAAQLVVQNGVGYDTFMNKIESASPNRHRKVIDVQTLRGLAGSTKNPHLWYDPKTMPKVAAQLVKDLSALAPAHASYFAANARRFYVSLKPWTRAIATFKREHPGTPVATTEPVGDYMLQAAGTRDLTPWSMQADIMNGVDPAPQDVSLQTSLFTGHRVKVFLYNQQVTDTLTESFLRQAAANHVPVIGVYETMPTGYDYQSWMLAEVTALERAVTMDKSTTKLH
jgi:zinc/manganese transport system substrate-binding protein